MSSNIIMHFGGNKRAKSIIGVGINTNQKTHLPFFCFRERNQKAAASEQKSKRIETKATPSLTMVL
jgi:hypothetical protein